MQYSSVLPLFGHTPPQVHARLPYLVTQLLCGAELAGLNHPLSHLHAPSTHTDSHYSLTPSHFHLHHSHPHTRTSTTHLPILTSTTHLPVLTSTTHTLTLTPPPLIFPFSQPLTPSPLTPSHSHHHSHPHILTQHIKGIISPLHHIPPHTLTSHTHLPSTETHLSQMRLKYDINSSMLASRSRYLMSFSSRR